MNLSNPLTNGLVLSLILGAPLGILAQQHTQKETEPEASRAEQASDEDAHLAQRELALQTLNAIIPMINKVEDFGEQVRLKARAAGLLWQHNEPQARIQFQQLLAAINRYQPKGKDAGEVNLVKNQSRRDVIQEAMRYDRQFADELAKQRIEEAKEPHSNETEKQSSAGQANPQQADTQRERYARAIRLAALAFQTLSENPERAAQLAEESMAEGIVTFQIFSLLIPLKMALGTERVNPLLERTLSLLSQNPTLTPHQLQALAVYIFPDLQLGNMPGPSPATPVVPLPLTQRFLALALVGLSRTAQQLAAPPASMPSERRQQMAMRAYFLVQQLRPKFEFYGTPEALVEVTSLVDQLGKHLTHEQRQMVEANAQPQANVATMIDLAKRETDANRRDAYFAQAAMSAYASGDYVNALKMAERIEHRELRGQVEQQIKQLLAQVFADRGEFDAAARYARELQQPAQRAAMLNLVARAWAKKGDQVQPLPLLAEAEQTAKKLADSVQKAQIMLWITQTHIQIESLRAFELLSQAVESINSAFDKQGSPRLLPTLAARATTPRDLSKIRVTSLFRFESLFQQLAHRDFARTLLIAQGLKRLELRLAAQLAACRALLVSDQHKQSADAGL